MANWFTFFGRIAALSGEKKVLTKELLELRGFFTGKRREIQNRLNEIELELNYINSIVLIIVKMLRKKL